MLSSLANQDRYEGMWFNDKKEGPGRFFYKSKKQVYEGEWNQGVAKCGTLHSTADGNDALVLPIVINTSFLNSKL